MTQEKKKSYSIYAPMGLKIPGLIRKMQPAHATKGWTDKKILGDYIVKCKDSPGDQSLYILSEESRFQRLGSQVVFPESTVILDNLLRARYSMETTEGFTLPFESFILAIPKGYAHDGCKIPTLLVNVIKKHTTTSEFIHPLLDEHDVPRFLFTVHDVADGDVLSLIYTETDSPEKHRVYLAFKYIPLALQAKNPGEYRDAMFEKGFLRSRDQLDDRDSAIQFYAFRLISALGVYHAATQGEKLRAGFPTGEAPKFDGWKSENKLSPVTLTTSMPPLASSAMTKDSYYRCWFFRQLRADRYYKGEYALYSPGSRYSFVQETVVGMDASPSTQS